MTKAQNRAKISYTKEDREYYNMSENTQEQEVSREQLFLQAIQERMAQLVVDYEAKVAELRVEYTLSEQNVKQLTELLEKQNAVQESPAKAK